MSEKILFITGHLARPSLLRVLEAMQPTEFEHEVVVLGAQVAALMTPTLIRKRLQMPPGIDRVMLPGRMKGNLEELEQHFGVPFERGPEELKDLPAHFGQAGLDKDLSQYDTRIFAEITEAPDMTPQQILDCAQRYREDGADIIDVGCLPGTAFPHLTESIQLLKQEGFQVSVDSLEPEDLLAGARAGADFLLSLRPDMLWIAEETDATPVLIGDSNADPASLYASIETLQKNGKKFLADPILDPIHSGCAASIVRYVELRRRYPDIEILMGIGNLTELTHADTAGMNALLFGLISELAIDYVLVTQVSKHCRSAIREADLVRRIMRVAASYSIPPTGIDNRLMMLHERDPFPYTPEEVSEIASGIRDPNFRIQVTEEGIHLYNRDGEWVHTDPLDFYPDLRLDDEPGHLFYLGAELARARIAWLLGKRFEQDEDLAWGCAVKPEVQDPTRFKEPGPTRTQLRHRLPRKKPS